MKNTGRHNSTTRRLVPLVSLILVAGYSAGNLGAASDGIDEFLLPPDGAVSFSAEQSQPLVAPTSGEPMSLPYAHVLPLPEGPIGDPDRTYTFCFSQALAGSTWAVAQADSVALEAARHPNVEVIYRNTDNDPLQQVTDIETCNAQGVDGFVIWPHSVETLTPEIEKLYEEGKVVVGMERTVATRDYSTWIYLDNVQATGDLARQVCADLGGQGVIAETEGAIGSSPQILRRDGFQAGIEETCPDVEIVYTAPTDYSRGQGYEVGLDFLQTGQEVDAWFTHYTEIGVGVDQALADFDLRGTVPHYSIVDGTVAVQNLMDGMFTAIAPWTPVHGDVGLRAAIYHVTGMEVPTDLVLQQPPLITADNAADQLALTWPG